MGMQQWARDGGRPSARGRRRGALAIVPRADPAAAVVPRLDLVPAAVPLPDPVAVVRSILAATGGARRQLARGGPCFFL